MTDADLNNLLNQDLGNNNGDKNTVYDALVYLLQQGQITKQQFNTANSNLSKVSAKADANSTAITALQGSTKADKQSIDTNIANITVNSENVAKLSGIMKDNGTSMSTIKQFMNGDQQSVSSLASTDSNLASQINTNSTAASSAVNSLGTKEDSAVGSNSAAITSVSTSASTAVQNVKTNNLHGLTFADIKPNK